MLNRIKLYDSLVQFLGLLIYYFSKKFSFVKRLLRRFFFSFEPKGFLGPQGSYGPLI